MRIAKLLDLALADDNVHDSERATLEGRLDVLDEVVDDLVLADLDAVAHRDLFGPRLDVRVEHQHDRVRCRGQQDVRFAGVADCAVDDAHAALAGGKVFQRVSQGLQGALRVGLEHDVQVLGLRLSGVEGGAQADESHVLLVGHGLLAMDEAALLCDVTCGLLVFNDGKGIACLRVARQAENLDGSAGEGGLDAQAVVVD